MIPRVVRALEQCGIEVMAEELADILWLAPHLTPGARGRIRSPDDEGPTPTAEAAAPPPESEAAEPEAKERDGRSRPRTEEVERAAPLLRAGGGRARGGELAFETPGAAALGQELGLSRALRPLMRRVPSRTDFVLDEEATAHRMAEARILSPVLRARPERWLDVALVVDVASTMAPWERTVLELHRFLERHGAFRRVRRWALSVPSASGEPVRIARCRSGSLEPSRWTSPRELVDPSGRRLTIVISDAVAPAWHDGRVCDVLARLAEHGPAVLVTPLPESLWAGTGLGGQHRVFLRAMTPATANAHFATDDLDLWAHAERPHGLPLPVLTLEPSRVRRVAELIAATGEAWAPGVLFRELETPVERRSGPRSAEQRVTHFLGSASPAARKLAAALSVVPLSLPIMRLVQQAVLPGSGPLVLAEVFRAGLFAPRAGAPESIEGVAYEFAPQVRERLQDRLRIGDAEKVLRQVSTWIERRAGKRSGFAARLRGSEDDAPELGDTDRPFALIAASALRRMGPRFAALAAGLDGGAPWSRAAAGAESVTIERPEAEPPAPSEAPPEAAPSEAQEPAPPPAEEATATGGMRAIIVLPDAAERRDRVDARVLALRLRRYGYDAAEVIGPPDPGEVEALMQELREQLDSIGPGDTLLLVAMVEATGLAEPVVRIGSPRAEGLRLREIAERVQRAGVRLIAALETDGAPPDRFEAVLSRSLLMTVARGGRHLLSGWLVEQVTETAAEAGGIDLRTTIEQIERADRAEGGSRRISFRTPPDTLGFPLALSSPVQQALWVDDQPRNNDAERLRFESLGVEITIATSTEHALEIQKSRARMFDVIISDLVRREDAEAGLELLSALRSMKVETPFVLYTAPGYREANLRAKEMGAWGIVTSPQGLLRTLDEILDLESASAAAPVEGSFKTEWEAAAEAPDLLVAAEKEKDPERAGALAQSAVIALGQNRQREGTPEWLAHHDLRLRALRILARSKTEGTTLADLAEALVQKAEALPAHDTARFELVEDARVILEDRLEELPGDPDGSQSFLLLRAKLCLIETLAATGEAEEAMKQVFWSDSYLRSVAKGFDRHHRERAADSMADLARRFARNGYAEEAITAGRFAIGLVSEEEIPQKRRDRAQLAELYLELARHEADGHDAASAETSYRRAISILHVQVGESRSGNLPGEVVTLGEAQHNLARTLDDLDRTAEALEIGADAVDTLRSLREQQPTRFTQAFLLQGLRLIRAGRLDAAHEVAEELRAFTARTSDPILQSHAARLRGEVALARGNPGAARQRFEEARAHAERSGDDLALTMAVNSLERLATSAPSETPARLRSCYISGELRYKQFTRRLKQQLTRRGVHCDTKVPAAPVASEAPSSRNPADHFDTVLLCLGDSEKPSFLMGQIEGFLDRADVAGDSRAVAILSLDSSWPRHLPPQVATRLQPRFAIDASGWKDKRALEAVIDMLLEFLAEPPPVA